MTHSSGYDLEGLAKRRFSSFLMWKIAHPSLDYNAVVVFIKKH